MMARAVLAPYLLYPLYHLYPVLAMQSRQVCMTACFSCLSQCLFLFAFSINEECTGSIGSRQLPKANHLASYNNYNKLADTQVHLLQGKMALSVTTIKDLIIITSILFIYVKVSQNHNMYQEHWFLIKNFLMIHTSKCLQICSVMHIAFVTSLPQTVQNTFCSMYSCTCMVVQVYSQAKVLRPSSAGSDKSLEPLNVGPELTPIKEEATPRETPREAPREVPKIPAFSQPPAAPRRQPPKLNKPNNRQAVVSRSPPVSTHPLCQQYGVKPAKASHQACFSFFVVFLNFNSISQFLYLIQLHVVWHFFFTTQLFYLFKI